MVTRVGCCASGIVATGLLVVAWVVPGVSLSLSGFIVAVVVFSVAQAILSLLILKLPHGYASLLLWGHRPGLKHRRVESRLGITHGLTIRGIASWVAATVVVWLVTTVGAISLPELARRLSGEEVTGIDPSEVTPETSFVDDLDIDSLSMVEIAVQTEDKYGVQIPDEDLAGLRTLEATSFQCRIELFRSKFHALTLGKSLLVDPEQPRPDPVKPSIPRLGVTAPVAHDVQLVGFPAHFAAKKLADSPRLARPRPRTNSSLGPPGVSALPPFAPMRCQ